jgi:hypothetical protein
MATDGLIEMNSIYRDRHDYPIHAEWLGCLCRRVSSHGWQRSVPDEGCGSFGCISLFAEAGCRESVTFHQRYDQPVDNQTERDGRSSTKSKEDGVIGRVQRRGDSSDLERNKSGTDQK